MTNSICSQCQHLIKGQVRTCPLCGGGMTSEQNDSPRQCPRCQLPLTVHQYQKLQIDQCQQCHGLWIEPDKFSVLTSEYSVYRDDNVDPNYLRPSLPKAEGYLPCACCQKLMTRQNFKAISGVIIDLCNRCGVWLDKNELDHIRSFIASGGLDKAQNRQLEQHSQQIQQLDDRLSDVELMEKMLNKFSVKRIFFRGF